MFGQGFHFNITPASKSFITAAQYWDEVLDPHCDIVAVGPTFVLIFFNDQLVYIR